MRKFPKFVFINDSTLVRRDVNNVLRSDMETGPAKTRPIQSVPLYNVSAEIAYNIARHSDWRSFWRNDIGFGAYWFLMKDPFDGVLRKFRFLETEIDWQKSGNLMKATVSLEAYDV